MKNRIKYIFISIIFIALTATDSFSFWQTQHGNSQRTGISKDAGPDKGTERWSFAKVNLDSTVAVSKKNVIYTVGFKLKTLYALSPKGQILWKYIAKASQLTSPSIGTDGTIYLVRMDRQKSYLLALTSNSGKKKWEVEVSSARGEYWLPHIAISKNGRIYVSIGNNLGAFNSKGKVLWSYEFISNNSKCNTAPSFSPKEDVIYVYRRCGEGVYAFNLDGSVKWVDKTKYTSEYTPPVIAPDGTIYILDGTTSSLFALAPNKKKKWKATYSGFNLGFSTMALGLENLIYVAMGNENIEKIIALDRKDGKIIWSFDITEGNHGGSVSLALAVDSNDVIYHAASNGLLYVLNNKGKLMWKHKIGSALAAAGGTSLIHTYPALSNKTFYAISIDGVLHVIGAPN